jgi:aspartate kinase
MRVLKFGGTSVGSPENLAKVREIVRAQREYRPVVVVSAHGGVTDELLAQARAAARGDYDLGQLRRRHAELHKAIGVDGAVVDRLFSELDDLLKGVTLLQELTARSLDLVVSFGERMSVRGIAEYLDGVPVDAYDIGMRTDSRFAEANPDPECFADLKAGIEAIDGLPIVTGFIAKDAVGNVTTLGRSGSDLTATLLGAALDADEVQIWTDVDGVMTADPRMVDAARSIPVLSIAEASELAYYGAKVIHPATMLPAVERRIPVCVKNTSKPEHDGTRILAQAPPAETAVKSIAYKRGITLITISSTRMLLQSGFMAKIFEVFSRYDLSVDLVATSEVTVSVTVDANSNLDAVIAELGAFSDVEVEHDMAQVCVVGEGIRERVGVAAEVFLTLKREELPVRLISHGGTKINISFLLESATVERAVRALHSTFFE